MPQSRPRAPSAQASPRPVALPGLAFAAILAAILVLPSCSTPPHRISLKDGSTLDAKNQPALSTKTGYWRFKDRFGKDALVRADEVLLIERL
jgi:hypothetical protein